MQEQHGASQQMGKKDGDEARQAGHGPYEPPPISPAAGTFTRFVVALAARSDSLQELSLAMRRELRGLLVEKMKSRSLWLSPPAFVGVLGHPEWRPADVRDDGSPLDELLHDCYVHIFGERLPRLLHQLKVRSQIDGLVVVLVDQFLTGRQKYLDPLGYRLFDMLCGAVKASVALANMVVLRGPKVIRNATVLGPSEDLDPDAQSPVEQLRPKVAEWNRDLLPELIVAEHRERRRTRDALQARVEALPDDGVPVFLFKDLLDALKQDVRARWRGLEEETAVEQIDEDGRQHLVKVLRPQTRVDDLDGFKKWVLCVWKRIPQTEVKQKKTYAYLRRLWSFLLHWSCDDPDTLPSNRDLGEALEIPRERLPGLYGTLTELMDRCMGILSAPVVDIETARPHAEPDGGDGHD